MKHKLLGLNPQELKGLAVEMGLPSFAGKQIAEWLYKKKVKSIDQMTNLSKVARERLSEKYEVGIDSYTDMQASVDGTKKYLFPCHTGSSIEAVMIPSEDRYTLCVSSQAGCKMACKFCMTGRQGFMGNLTVAEILSQYIAVDECDKLTNTVFMGMGEPLDNFANVLKAIEVLTAEWGFAWSPKRITLSSIGVNKSLENLNGSSALKEYLESNRCHLAISLHNMFPQERVELMPMEKAFPIEDTLDVIYQYDFSGQRRVSFEYIMFDRVNDTKRHADAIIKELRGFECRVNLIRFHAIPDSDLRPSPIKVMESFRDRLNNAGITTTIRASRGEDIFAACGMLAGKEKQE